MSTSKDVLLAQEALEYHEFPKPGKLAVDATKPVATIKDLALAYSPGVAAPCREIVKDPRTAQRYTGRGNLVAVITNGTAVLGLGNIGPLAAKPVMEGKAVLFKKFAGIDVFDLEINQQDPDKFVEIVASLEPTFGGINLEDIKAPECFYIEQELIKRLNIPVFHDDQHGTAIVVTAAVLNGLKLVGKKIDTIKCVVVGAGAAALACLEMLCAFGLSKDKLFLFDAKGLVYHDRTAPVHSFKQPYARSDGQISLDEAMAGCDLFIGLSVAGAITPQHVASMAASPLIFALANPTPEIMPEEVLAVRQDALIGTGRSDYPNQINNVLCFPYLFRGALDVSASTINTEMKMACVRALADLAQAEPSDLVSMAYGGQTYTFGPNALIPKLFDPRLMVDIAAAVAQAAMQTGVARRPLTDMGAYRHHLTSYVFRSTPLMTHLFQKAKEAPQKIAFSEGEEERVLQAVQSLVNEGLVLPTLVGRREVIEERLKKLGLRLVVGTDVEIVDPTDEATLDRKGYWTVYHRLMERKGVSPGSARQDVRTNHTILASLLALQGEVEGVICGPVCHYTRHVKLIEDIVGRDPCAPLVTSLSGLILDRGSLFFADTYLHPTPSPHQLAEIAALSAQAVKRFGLTPRVAFVSHSNFGSTSTGSASTMEEALDIFRTLHPKIEAEGEMNVDVALDEDLRRRIFPNSQLQENANILIMPSLEAAHIAFNTAKGVSEAQTLGPLLLGLQRPAHVLTTSVTPRGIFNMAVVAGSGGGLV